MTNQTTYPERFSTAFDTALSQSLRIATLHKTLDEQLPRIAEVGSGYRRWVLTGSGDSLFAAMAMRPLLRRWTGLDVEVRTSLELARYEAPLLDPVRDLVIAVSNSGSSSRTRETVALSRDRGVTTLGISGSANGPLAKSAEHLLLRPVAGLDELPAQWGRVFLNMSEYIAALVTLAELGAASAVILGRATADDAAAMRAEAARVIDKLPQDAERMEPRLAELAAGMAQQRAIWAIGSGPSRGTVAYAAAKFHEQVPLAGIAQDLEEWAHLEYFLTLAIGSESVVLMHAPPGASTDRARELSTGIAGAGGRALVITGEGEAEFPNAEAMLTLSSVDELLSPLSYHLPAQLLALHIARVREVSHIPLRRTDDYWLIRGGAVRTKVETH